MNSSQWDTGAISAIAKIGKAREAPGLLRVALMIESDSMGGAEMMTLRLGRELGRRGHAVHFVGPAPGVGWLAAQFRQSGIATSTVAFSRGLDLSAYAALSQLVRQWHPDVVHSHQFAFAVYGAAVAKRYRIPHVSTMHGNPGITANWRRRAALRWARRHSAALVAVSEATRHEFTAALGPRGRPLAMIPNGVPMPDTSSGSVRSEFALDDTPLLLSVGNLLPVKGHITLLRALTQLGERPWRLMIIGRHDEAVDELKAYIALHDWGDRVLLPGVRHDVGAFLGVATAFVMPSLWEGLPLALLEAMRAGLPIVASDVAGIPEAISNGIEGVLVPAASPDRLAGALSQILDDPALRARLGTAARIRASNEYSIEVMADRYLELYAAAGAGQHKHAAHGLVSRLTC